MTVYLGFNKTDGYYGWNSELSGYTVFYNWMEGIGNVKAVLLDIKVKDHLLLFCIQILLLH